MSNTETDTTDVRKGRDLGANLVEAFLNSEVYADDSAVRITNVAQFGFGQSNPTFLLTLESPKFGEKKIVLRKPPPGTILSPTAHRVDREYKMLSALGSHSAVPVPRVFAFTSDESIVGKPFYVMEFVKGRIFKDPKLPELDAHERKRAWKSVVETLAAIHNVDVDGSGLGSFSKSASNYYSRQLKTLAGVSAKQAAVDADRVPRLSDLGGLVERIARNVLPSEEREKVVVHGDYKCDNTIMSPERPEVVAVLDWEMATLGSYGADLGNCLAPFFISADVVDSSIPLGALSPITPEMAKEEQLPSRHELLEWYASARSPPLDLKVLKVRIHMYLAFYFFKTFVILQGVAARAVKGQASSAVAELVGSFAPLFGELSIKALDELDALNKKSSL